MVPRLEFGIEANNPPKLVSLASELKTRYSVSGCEGRESSQHSSLQALVASVNAFCRAGCCSHLILPTGCWVKKLSIVAIMALRFGIKHSAHRTQEAFTEATK